MTTIAANTMPINPVPQQQIVGAPIVKTHRRFNPWWILGSIPFFLIGFRLGTLYLPADKNFLTRRDQIHFENAIFSPIAALTRIEERNAATNAVTSLNWDITDYVSTVPDTIGALSSLQTITIQNQPFHTLPDSIGNLTRLKTLHIINTPLTSLPNSIGNLTELTDLKIVGTNIQELPATIGNLTELETLTLSHNKLTKIPPLFQLEKLYELDIADNQLTSIPKDLPPNLDFIYIGENKISQKEAKVFDNNGVSGENAVIKGVFW